MMETNPAATAFFDVLFEGRQGGGSPHVGRIVQLDKKLVVREEVIVDLVGVFDVVDAEVLFFGELIEPDVRSIDEGFMDAAGFRNGDNLEARLYGL